MKTINKKELDQEMHANRDLLLIDVLPKESFAKQHIPNAVNIPVKDNSNFVKEVEAKATSKTKPIAVYCASTQCDASQVAADKLEQAGFTNVERFEEGLAGWFQTKPAQAAA